MTDHLLKEVDDALKLHRLQQLWRKNKQQIILGVSIAVVSLIALLIWKQQQQVEMQRQSELLLTALSAKETGEAMPDISSLSGSHLQLANLLQARDSADSDPLILQAKDAANGNDLLSSYACLLASQNDQNISCATNATFKPLMAEFQIIHHLHAGEISQANELLKAMPITRDPMAKRRISNLSAYVNSSLADHLSTTPMNVSDDKSTK